MARLGQTMTLLIGIKTDRAGFTLIEILIAVAILSLATVFIFQSNLLSAAVYGRYASRLDIQNWAAQKIWQAKESILGSEFPDTGSNQGSVKLETRTYDWALHIEEEKTESADVYQIELKVSWMEGGQPASLERFGGAIKLRK